MDLTEHCYALADAIRHDDWEAEHLAATNISACLGEEDNPRTAPALAQRYREQARLDRRQAAAVGLPSDAV